MLRTAPDGRKYLHDAGQYFLLEDDGKKFSHDAVDYHAGDNGEFCRNCEYSDHKQPKPHCKYVEDIDRGGWCKLWTRE